VLAIVSYCVSLMEVHSRSAAKALRDGRDVVLIPAEDGGYVLIGTRSTQPALFADISWGTQTVLAETRARVMAHRLVLAERPPLWGVDTEIDLARLEREYPALPLWFCFPAIARVSEPGPTQSSKQQSRARLAMVP